MRGAVNTASAFLGSIGGPMPTLDNALLSGIFGSVTSAVNMLIDVIKNRQEINGRSAVFGNRLYSYAVW